MANPTLLGLPSEIRLMIYREVFGSQDSKIDPSRPKRGTAVLAAYSSLIKTCRILHSEVAEWVYQNIEFFFEFATKTKIGRAPDLQASINSFLRWSKTIGSFHAGQVRKVCIELPPPLQKRSSRTKSPVYIEIKGLVAFCSANPRCSLGFATSRALAQESLPNDVWLLFDAAKTEQEIQQVFLSNDICYLFEATAIGGALQQVVKDSAFCQQLLGRFVRKVLIESSGTSGFVAYTYRSIPESRRYFTVTPAGIAPATGKTTLLDLPTPILHDIYAYAQEYPFTVQIRTTVQSDVEIGLPPCFKFEDGSWCNFRALDGGSINGPNQLAACKSMYNAARQLFLNFCTFEFIQDVSEYEIGSKSIRPLHNTLAKMELYPWTTPQVRIIFVVGEGMDLPSVRIPTEELRMLHNYKNDINVVFKHGDYQNTVSLQAIGASRERFKAQRRNRPVNIDDVHLLREKFWMNGHGQVVDCTLASDADWLWSTYS